MKAAYSKFMSLNLTKKEWFKTLMSIITGALLGYFAEIYNDIDFTNITNFDFIQAGVDAFNDWRAILNKIIFAFGVYFLPTFFRNSEGKYFTRENK